MTNTEFYRGAISASECVGNGWSIVTAKFGLYLGIGLVTILLISCIPFLNVILMGPVLGGFYYVVLRDMRGESVDFGMMFKGFERFVPLMLGGLVQAVPGIVLQVVQYTVDIARLIAPGIRPGRQGDFFQSGQDLGLAAGLSAMFVILVLGLLLVSIVWHLALYFTIPLIIDRNLGVVEALTLSMRAAFSNLGALILLIILQVFVALLGVLALCVGIFVAIPVIYASNAFAYRQVFPLIEQNVRTTTPPPPDVYGGSFGQQS